MYNRLDLNGRKFGIVIAVSIGELVAKASNIASLGGGNVGRSGDLLEVIWNLTALETGTCRALIASNLVYCLGASVIDLMNSNVR